MRRVRVQSPIDIERPVHEAKPRPQRVDRLAVSFLLALAEKAVNKGSCPAHGTTAALLIDTARGYDDLTEVGRRVGTIDDCVHGRSGY